MKNRPLLLGASLTLLALALGCGAEPTAPDRDPSWVGGKADIPGWLRPIDAELSCGAVVPGRFDGPDSAHLFQLGAAGPQIYTFFFQGSHAPQAGAAVAVYDAQTGARLGIDRRPGEASALLELELAVDTKILVAVYSLADQASGDYTLTVSCQPLEGALAPLEPAPSTPGGISLLPETQVVFASKVEGAQLLTTVDDYIRALSPFDRSFMSQTPGEVTPQAFAQHLASLPVDWTASEMQLVEDVVQAVGLKLQPYDLDLPPTISLVKVQGGPELPYTRGSFVVVPAPVLQLGASDLETIVTHELFHILSRHDPGLRQQLYAIIGFTECPELAYPAELADLKLTNPDTPLVNQAIKVSVFGQPYDVVPITYSPVPYSSGMGTNPLAFVTFKLLAVQTGPGETLPLYWNGKPFTLDVAQVPSYLAQVGMNTQYLIHPDEILADNFVQLIQGKTSNLPSPQIPQQMAQLLKKP